MQLKKILFLLFAIFFMTAQADSVRAQCERNIYIPANSIDYDVYMYPTNKELFSLPTNFEIKFTASNGKYFYLMFEDTLGKSTTNVDVYLYTPCGKKLGKQNIKTIINSYTIPQNCCSINSETIKVRIVNHDSLARNFKFVVVKPKTPYRGDPVSPCENFDTFDGKINCSQKIRN